MTHAEIREEPLSGLAGHATISSAYLVERVLDVTMADRGIGGLAFVERVLAAPYAKEYDALPGNGPMDWPTKFDVSRWGVLSAWMEGRRVGGAVIAFDTPGVHMLDDRNDLAVLWDLRVDPGSRRRGVGGALFAAAEQWATTRGCRRLRIETQNVNVPACRFYASRGCELEAVHRFAYPELPDETQLLWGKELGAAE